MQQGKKNNTPKVLVIGIDGATIDFKLTDAGEPGKGVDLAEFSINGGAALAVAGTLDKGNHQAHPE